MEKYKERISNFYDDIVMDVVHVYFEREILNKDSLLLFLNRHLHLIFHNYTPTIPCCNCGTTSLAAPGKKNKINQKQFEDLFDCNDPVSPGHERRKSGNYTQHCLCKISPKSSVQVIDMDITLICILVKICCTPNSFPGNPRLLEDVKKIRNHIHHLGDSNSLSMKDFEEKWKILEKAITEIARITGNSYENSVKKRIDALKHHHLKMDNLTDAITACNVISENKILEALRNFGVHIENMFFQIKHAEFSETGNTEENIEIESSDMVPDEQSDLNAGQMKCYVRWNFATPGNWNVKQMIEKLKHVSALMDFKLIFVHEGSLIIKTSISTAVVNDTEKFIHAIQEFLLRLTQECEIDTKVQTVIDIDVLIVYVPCDDYIVESCNSCKEKNAELNAKEEEIMHLKKDLNNQLNRLYSSTKADMSLLNMPSFVKSFYIDKPLDDLLDRWEDEQVLKSLEPDYISKYESITGSVRLDLTPTETDVIDDEKLGNDQILIICDTDYTATSQESSVTPEKRGKDQLFEISDKDHTCTPPKSTVVYEKRGQDPFLEISDTDHTGTTPKSSVITEKLGKDQLLEISDTLNTVATPKNINVPEKLVKDPFLQISDTDLTSTTQESSIALDMRYNVIKITGRTRENDVVDESTDLLLKQTQKDEELTLMTTTHKRPMFKMRSSFSINCEEHMHITGLALSENNNIVICNICTNRLLLFSDQGQYIADCNLVGEPWGISLFPKLNEETSTISNEVGIVTIPDQSCYQYIILTLDGVAPGKCVFVGFDCFGVKTSDDNILVGGNKAIHIFNRQDEVLSVIETECCVLQIDLLNLFNVGCHEKEPSSKFGIVFLGDKSIFNYVILECTDMSNIILSHRLTLRETTAKNITGLAVGRHNHLNFILDSANDIYKSDFAATFIRITIPRAPIDNPSAICFSNNYDKLYVATKNGRKIVILDNNEYVSF